MKILNEKYKQAQVISMRLKPCIVAIVSQLLLLASNGCKCIDVCAQNVQKCLWLLKYAHAGVTKCILL